MQSKCNSCQKDLKRKKVRDSLMLVLPLLRSLQSRQKMSVTACIGCLYRRAALQRQSFHHGYSCHSMLILHKWQTDEHKKSKIQAKQQKGIRMDFQHAFTRGCRVHEASGIHRVPGRAGPHPEGWIVRGLTCFQLPIPRLQPLTFKLHGTPLTSVPRLPFL